MGWKSPKAMPVAMRRSNRAGAIVVLTAILLVPMLGIVACAVDYGYLLKKRAELQRAADAAALAAVRDLVPADDGSQDLSKVRDTARQYAAANMTDVANFNVLDGDIEIGRYDPATVYTNFTILNSGTFDTVRVTLRRDGVVNSPVSLFFARVFGVGSTDVNVVATAVLQKASIMEPGVGVMPFTIPQAEWSKTNPGAVWNIYGDGRMEDGDGNLIAGNWGTCDIGDPTNSTWDMRDQILNGLRQIDLDGLYAEGRIPTDEHIDSTEPMYANGDPGLSTGVKHAVQAVHGEKRLIPIYDSVTEKGGRLEFHISGWAVCTVVDSVWHGANNSAVMVKKSHQYIGLAKPQTDLRVTTDVIEGAFTSPVLVE